jgi:phage shock protein C
MKEIAMKRLYRSRKNKVIAGVCGGLAEYLEVDPVLVRLVAVLLLFVGGGSLLAYIIGMIIIPERPIESVKDFSSESTIIPSPPSDSKSGQTGGLIVGVILIILGISFLMKHIPFFNQYYWWFWHMGWNFFWPSLLILIGLLIIIKAGRNQKNGE